MPAKDFQTKSFALILALLCCIMLLIPASAMASGPNNQDEKASPAGGPGHIGENPVPDTGPGTGDEDPVPDGIDDIVRLINILYGPTLPVIR